MLRFLLCCLLVFGTLGKVRAQDWRTVRVEDTTFFTASIYPAVIGQPSPDTTVLRSAWISGIQPAGSDTTFRFFTGIREDVSNGCIDTAAPHWLGPSITRLADGRELYFNSAGDTITMYPDAPLFFTWIIARDTNGNRYEGTVGAVGTLVIDGVSDSIKTVYIQAFSGNAPVSHYINSLQMGWSKSHGWIKTVDFYGFPYGSPSGQLVGTEMNYSQHHRLPKAFNQLNLDSVDIPGKYTVGNEWMWLEGNSGPGSVGINGHDSVMASAPYGNGVIATIRRRMRTVNFWNGSDVFTDTVVADTVLPTGAAPRRVQIEVRPDFKDRAMYQTLVTSTSQTNHSLYKRYLVRSLCGGALNRIGDHDILITPTPVAFAGCWRVAYSSTVWRRRSEDVVPGFGRVFSRLETDPNTGPGVLQYEVYYFKFGGCTAGGKLPITAGITAGRAMNAAFSIHPNPASASVILRAPSAQPASIMILDVMGRPIFCGTTTGVETQIPTASLPSGVYFVEVSGREGRTTLKLQVLQ